ncbi:MAG: hypothetical protein HXX11_00030 [Desulfuromonadales bacterium]|nr:hypothetical protein [Desulfuromonadales bacterium]
MKKLLTWGGTGLLTTAILDPLLYSMMDMPIPWWRDLVMLCAGIGCLYLLFKYRREW